MGLFGDIVNAFEVPRKSKGSAYAALVFFGLTGWHEFYLEKHLRGILYILASIAFMIGWNLPIVPLAYISAGVLVVFSIFDLVTLSKQVDNWNNENAGNVLVETAGAIAGEVISIPLNNAIEEYKGTVAEFREAIEQFNKKKTKVESLLGRLQEARKDTISVISKMREIIDKISSKEKELVRDELGEQGNLSENIMDQVIFGNEDLSASLDESIDAASLEMTETFNAARDLTQYFESNAGKFAAATAATVIQGIIEYSRQQEKIIELKQGREDTIKQQNEIEIKIRQLEATDKRAEEILKVIEGAMPGFDHLYNEFCTAVFPEGVLYQKEAKILTPDERKLLQDLALAARKVIAIGSQEIN